MNKQMERPIIFKGEMVRAILDGHKTMTRRIVKFNTRLTQSIEHQSLEAVYPARLEGWVWWSSDHPELRNFTREQYETGLLCPYGKPCDLLWVRETWAYINNKEFGEESYYEYKADTGHPYPGGWPPEEAKGNPEAPKWKPSIFMPRPASRITLNIKSVWVERLQDICVADCIAEGISKDVPLNNRGTGAKERDGFAELWDSINVERGSWISNPWVWVIGFSVKKESP